MDKLEATVRAMTDNPNEVAAVLAVYDRPEFFGTLRELMTMRDGQDRQLLFRLVVQAAMYRQMRDRSVNG